MSGSSEMVLRESLENMRRERDEALDQVQELREDMALALGEIDARGAELERLMKIIDTKTKRYDRWHISGKNHKHGGSLSVAADTKGEAIGMFLAMGGSKYASARLVVTDYTANHQGGQ